ncbi:MAG TPA: group III truncated hemoglobin [Flavobacteriaceae bacterium]|nr:group III truncated hemoglobin [Bacteroidota bacterium]HPF11183.1 group III truncated hemoglobin [Flavobacteriaceae bacterium]HQU22429.1 group III truncated hemoglobin [Flavobacteriaceae bacterium]HQU66320.1 group III truncated hemoglobin [Flavobacteriaceae bacterium]HRW43698.1 group III truncated hemoglobin [Flavobacteriaceae bacterium]
MIKKEIDRPKKDIQNREDIFKLVSTFYGRIRRDELLGPIFNSHIEKDKWPAHLQKLTDFWTTNLFAVACFKGNPTLAHINVDRNLNNEVEQKHFDTWLGLWFNTIDSLFKGELAEKAKNAASNMAVRQFQVVLNARMNNEAS